MAVKRFKSTRQVRPPVEFELEFLRQRKTKIEDPNNPGQFIEQVVENEWDEETRTFHARTRIPGGILLDTAPGADVEGASRQAKAIRELWKAAIVEYDDWMELISSTETVVEADAISEVANWIIEEASNRPTTGPSGF